MQTLSCSPELPGWPSTPREAQRAALGGEIILTETSSAGEIFSKRGINLSLTKNIPVSKAFVWSWEWFGCCWTLLGWRRLGGEKWRVLHRWEWGFWDEGSPASQADGALPDQAVIRSWHRVLPALLAAVAPRRSSLHKPS